MPITKVEIDKNKPLAVGDRIELHFKSVGLAWLQATQIAAIDYKLSGRTDWRIRSWTIPNETTVIFEVEVLHTSLVTAAIIGGVIIGVGIMVWLTLDKVYQIISTPAGQVAASTTGVGLAAVGIALLYWMFKK